MPNVEAARSVSVPFLIMASLRSFVANSGATPCCLRRSAALSSRFSTAADDELLVRLFVQALLLRAPARR